MSLKVFVTGLPLQTNDDDLHQYFGQFGPIEMAYVVTKYVKKTRIGYVCFRRKLDKNTVLAYPNHRIRGQRIFVLDYHSKEESDTAYDNGAPAQASRCKSHLDSLETLEHHQASESRDEYESDWLRWQQGTAQRSPPIADRIDLDCESNLRFNIESVATKFRRIASIGDEHKQRTVIEGSQPTFSKGGDKVYSNPATSGSISCYVSYQGTQPEYRHKESLELATNLKSQSPVAAVHHNPSLKEFVGRATLAETSCTEDSHSMVQSPSRVVRSNPESGQVLRGGIWFHSQQGWPQHQE